MRRIKLTVAYDGTNYHGWQLQPHETTIEGVLNQTISLLTGEPIKVIGASRTDAGVHALGNVAVFDTVSRIPGDKFAYALNQRLPDDIVIQGSEEVASDFHPRHCDCQKTYEYTILNRRFPLPQYRHTALFDYSSLDLEAMRLACGFFLGEHDFAGFCSSGAQVQTTVRTIYSMEIIETPLNLPGESFDACSPSKPSVCTSPQTADSQPAAHPDPNRLLTIRVRGNGFLYNMVRIIAGTLLAVGKGQIRPENIPSILASCERKNAGPTAPAQGLRLVYIDYLEAGVTLH